MWCKNKFHRTFTYHRLHRLYRGFGHQVLIKQYGQRRLQELGAHKRRKLQRQHQQPCLADAARLITDVIQPTCDVIPSHHDDETTPGGEESDHSDHVTRRAPGPFRRLTKARNGHILSYLPLNDARGNYTLEYATKALMDPEGRGAERTAVVS